MDEICFFGEVLFGASHYRVANFECFLANLTSDSLTVRLPTNDRLIQSVTLRYLVLNIFFFGRNKFVLGCFMIFWASVRLVLDIMKVVFDGTRTLLNCLELVKVLVASA